MMCSRYIQQVYFTLITEALTKPSILPAVANLYYVQPILIVLANEFGVTCKSCPSRQQLLLMSSILCRRRSYEYSDAYTSRICHRTALYLSPRRSDSTEGPHLIISNLRLHTLCVCNLSLSEQYLSLMVYF